MASGITIDDGTVRYDVEAVTLGTPVFEPLTARGLRPCRQLFVEFHQHTVRHVGKADTRRLVTRVAGFGFRTFSVDDHNCPFYRASA